MLDCNIVMLEVGSDLQEGKRLCRERQLETIDRSLILLKREKDRLEDEIRFSQLLDADVELGRYKTRRAAIWKNRKKCLEIGGLFRQELRTLDT